MGSIPITRSIPSFDRNASTSCTLVWPQRLPHQLAGASGTKYDIGRFHDAMLLSGAVPLELLERVYT